MIKLFLKKVWEDIKKSKTIPIVALFSILLYICLPISVFFRKKGIVSNDVGKADNYFSTIFIIIGTSIFLIFITKILITLIVLLCKYISKTWNEAKREEEEKYLYEVVSDDDIETVEDLRKIVNSHSIQIAKIRLRLGMEGED